MPARLCDGAVGIGLPRALPRHLSLRLILTIALVDAARIRLTTSPTATALARNRAAWLHRRSDLACSVLGLQIEREGYVPVSGLVNVDHMSLIDALLLSSMEPFAFVLDMGVHRRPMIGCLARLAGRFIVIDSGTATWRESTS